MNEVTIYIVSLLMSFILDVGMPTLLVGTVGWVIIAVASLNIGVNLVLTVVFSCKSMWITEKKRRFNNRAVKVLKDKLARR